jgi:hypothetical protein
MESLPAPFPKLAIQEVEDLLVPSDARKAQSLEFVLAIDNNDLRIRGLSDLLAFIDRIYGRLYPKGIRSYARTAYEHIRISRIKKGSWEAVIRAVLENKEAITALLIIRLAVKYLPGILESLSTSYSNYENAKYTREKRKALRSQMNKDAELSSLDRKRQDQLARFLDHLYEMNVTMVKNASKFTRESVIDVYIRLHYSDED